MKGRRCRQRGARASYLALCIALGCHEEPRDRATQPAPVDWKPAPRMEAALSTPDAVYGRSHAVVVGIDAYPYLSRLRGAVRDASAMAAALRSQGFEVTTLFDGEATLARLREVLGDRLRQKLGPDDRVLVYFAGHGVPVGERAAQAGYLMPFGGKSYLPFSTGLPMSELAAWFRGYPAKHVMFLADACYPGLPLGTRGVALAPAAHGYVETIASRSVRFSLVAGDADQEAHEWNGHGVFTHFVLEAIEGAADANGDGLVTSDELTSYVRPRVSELVHTRFQAEQFPQSARSGTGEFIFFASHDRSAANRRLARSETAALAAVPTDASMLPLGKDPPPLPPPDVTLELDGIFYGPEGRRLRIRREGEKTILVGDEPAGRFVLGMIEKRRGEARFEGAARILEGPDRGRLLQRFVHLTALDTIRARYEATSQRLDGTGKPLGEPYAEPAQVFSFEPQLPARNTPLDIVGTWEGGEQRRCSIEPDDAGPVIACTDRWGSFRARARLWADDEATFEGRGVMSAGPQAGTAFRVAIRLREKGDGRLSYEPIVQFLDERGVPTGASLLGYAWPLERVAPDASAPSP